MGCPVLDSEYYGFIARNEFQFKTGESLGVPIDKDVAFDSKVRMIDTGGNPVTENPAYYERIFPNGSKVRFPAGQTGVPPVINGNKGDDIAADSPDVMVEPIYRDNSIRQIWSAADGLADFEKKHSGRKRGHTPAIDKCMKA